MGYTHQFDELTLFYDVFQTEGATVLSGPPLLNLADDLDLHFFVDGRPSSAILADCARTQRSRLPDTGAVLEVVGRGLNARIAISPSGEAEFEGRRVLMTLSRNNPLRWIRDWASFYARKHGVDAVLVYDNGSDAYTMEELEDALSGIEGIPTVGVVNWPAKYGPGAGPDRMWDSNYLQTSQMEHARRRFLGRARQVINADVDELVVTADGRPLGDHLSDSRDAALLYRGRWVLATRMVEQGGSFSDYYHYDPQEAPCPFKWTVVPAMTPEEAIWDTHGFGEWRPEQTSDILYRHFRPISTNWKWRRTDRTRDERELLVDTELRAAMNLD